MIRQLLLNLEDLITSNSVLSWLILFPSFLVKKTLWGWGRLRFKVLVKSRGENCICHWNANLKYPENIELGNRVIIGTNVVIGARSKVILGDDVRLSSDVQIETAGLDFKSQSAPYMHQSQPVSIGSGVWIGSRSIILGGVDIGSNSVIAAGSIVSRNVPENTLVAGVPAKFIKEIPSK